MDIKLTNGKKTIIRTKEQYEGNKEKYAERGFKPEKSIVKQVADKVVKLKPRSKKKKKVNSNGKLYRCKRL